MHINVKIQWRVCICREPAAVRFLFNGGFGTFASGTLTSLFTAFAEPSAEEQRANADPYSLNPPGDRCIFPSGHAWLGKNFCLNCAKGLLPCSDAFKHIHPDCLQASVELGMTTQLRDKHSTLAVLLAGQVLTSQTATQLHTTRQERLGWLHSSWRPATQEWSDARKLSLDILLVGSKRPNLLPKNCWVV